MQISQYYNVVLIFTDEETATIVVYKYTYICALFTHLLLSTNPTYSLPFLPLVASVAFQNVHFSSKPLEILKLLLSTNDDVNSFRCCIFSI